MIKKLVLLTLFSFAIMNVYAITPAGNPSFKIRDIERILGRKLDLKEKLGFLIVKHKVKKTIEKSVKPNAGKTAFILGLIGLIALFIPIVNLASLPLAIMAISIGSKARRANPDDRKARTAITLGIITLSLFFLIAILVALILTYGTIGPR